LKDKETGVPVKNRKLRLRWFDNCFMASEAVKWMQEQLNITQPEAVALGRGLEREGFIAHVTLRHNFDDSSGLFFRFEDEGAPAQPQSSNGGLGSLGGGLGSAGSVAGLSDEPEVTPLAISTVPRPSGPMTGARKLTKMFDSNELGASSFHQQFWNVQPPNIPGTPSSGRSYSNNADNKSLTAKRRSLKTNMLLHALSSYVPNVVLRRFVANPQQLAPPETESYPASLLFADISGFTPLTEKLAQSGSRGVEQLTQYLNDYFGQMISIIFNHGGDIVKFAGDALLAVWPTTSEGGLPYATSIAAQCALTMQEHLHNWDADGVPLTLHIGIGAGVIHGLHVGGISNRMEFLIAGAPLEQAAHCEEAAKSGEVFISKEAAMFIKDSIDVSIDKKSASLASTSGKVKIKKVSWKPDLNDGQINYRLDRVTEAQTLPPSHQLPTNVPGMKKLISPYIQPAVLGHLKSGSPDHFLAELRTVSVIFVNLALTYSPEQINLMQEAVRMMQEAVYSFEGTIRQFIIDDKGSVLIAAFGLPPLSHEDDPARATRAAMLIHKNLKDMKIISSVGVTTGKAFCGAVGSEERREYAMVGDIVNLSARLMAKASGGILVDSPTYMASRSRISYKTLPSITVKGKSMAIDVYSPQREVQHDSGHSVRRPEKFGSIGRAMLLKSKLRTSSSKLQVEERLVGRQTEWKRINELITNLATQLENSPELITPREDDSSSAEQNSSTDPTKSSGVTSGKKDEITPRAGKKRGATEAKPKGQGAKPLAISSVPTPVGVYNHPPPKPR
jgi:class 3 adenylate cyclase